MGSEVSTASGEGDGVSDPPGVGSKFREASDDAAIRIRAPGMFHRDAEAGAATPGAGSAAEESDENSEGLPSPDEDLAGTADPYDVVEEEPAVPPELHVELPDPPERGILVRAKARDSGAGSPRRAVSWGHVAARHYKRAVGGGGVPSRGNWPLGLETVVVVPRGEAGGSAGGASEGDDGSEGGDDCSEIRLFGADGTASPYLRARRPDADAVAGMPSLDLGGPAHAAAGGGRWGPGEEVHAMRHASESRSPRAARAGREASRGRSGSFDSAAGAASPTPAGGGGKKRGGKRRGGKGGGGKKKKTAPPPAYATGAGAASPGAVARSVSMPPLHTLKPGEVLLGSVDEFEARRASELATRNGTLPPHQRTKGGDLETRQLSHRRGGGNRLFDRMDEAARRTLLRAELERRPGAAKDVADSSREEELELAALRHSRAEVGCSCRAADHEAKGMSAKRLRPLLEARGLSNKGSRAELLARLREAAESEPLCGASAGPLACPCAAAGLRCHYDVCKCDCDACSNPHGRDDYDRRTVVAHVRTHVKAAARLSREGEADEEFPDSSRKRRPRSKSMCA